MPQLPIGLIRSLKQVEDTANELGHFNQPFSTLCIALIIKELLMLLNILGSTVNLVINLLFLVL
jgi:hypothetical protein